MKIDVTEYEKRYSFELEPITQLCGQNVIKKTYILESIRRYFSTYKYAEEKNKWRDNVKINSENVGRKFFTVISISNVGDLLMLIRLSKQSLMVEYLKSLMQKFDWQLHLRAINEELEVMFQMMNMDLAQLGDVELTYAASDLWSMIQKSDITGDNQKSLQEKEMYELLNIFLNLLEQVMDVNPKKMMILLENIDHWISQDEYRKIVRRIEQLARRYDIYFVLSTSIDGYVVCDEQLCGGIHAVGEAQFQMPEFDEMLNYINGVYPCNKKLSKEELKKDLEKIVQKLGSSGYLYNVEENVICKLINQTLLSKEKWSEDEKAPEIAFLKD